MSAANTVLLGQEDIHIFDECRITNCYFLL